jgi:glycosyltransferase involved in cell wall biosynthesis
MKYSIIIPVYNRPDEVDELLESLQNQSIKDFEVIVVEDGSTKTCKDVCDKYTDSFTLHYFVKENGGPGPARNFGVEKASGEYVLILDSDCVIPEGYLAAIDQELTDNPCDAFGGPDAAHESFTDIQKAISYSMTSFFTTGGIRGGKKKLDKFYPRSFNMGMKRAVYNALNGFSKMRFGEDIDFSYRIFENGYSCRLFPEAWVWHKRRTDIGKFFKQVFNSGIARINLEKRHPGTMKLVHMLPMIFTVGVIFLLLLTIVLGATYYGCADCRNEYPCLSLWWIPLTPIVLYALLIFLDSSIVNKNAKIGMLSVQAAFVQLMGYGLGFLKAWWLRCVLGKSEFAAFEKNFYD